MCKQWLQIALAVTVCLSLSACFEPKVPFADGRTVLTVEQYEALTAKMNGEVKAIEEKIAATEPVGDDAFDSGARFYQNRDFVNAAVEFDKVTRADAKNSKAWYMLGSCYEHIGDVSKAQDAFKQSYDLMVAQGYIADLSKLR